MPRRSPIRASAALAAVSGTAAIIALGAGAAPALARAPAPGSASGGVTLPGFDAPDTRSDTPAWSADADFSDGPVQVRYDAQKAASRAPSQATGEFLAQTTTRDGAAMSLGGPVTCLDEQGPLVGLFYPVRSSTPAGVDRAIKGVYVSVEMGSGGRPVSFSFHPSTLSSVSSCTPTPGVIPILSGTGSETSGS